MRRAFLPLLLLLPLALQAEDLRLTDGTLYRQVRVSQVDPDGLIVSYEKGSAKIDYERLPAAMRQRYGIDPKKAATFRTTETRHAQQTAEE